MSSTIRASACVGTCGGGRDGHICRLRDWLFCYHCRDGRSSLLGDGREGTVSAQPAVIASPNFLFVTSSPVAIVMLITVSVSPGWE